MGNYFKYSPSDNEIEFQAVLEAVEKRREDFNELRYVPRDIIDLMKKAGIFRASTPSIFGGNPMPPFKFMEMVERISTVDGSAGWVSAFGSANTYLATLPIETQKKVYATGPDQVFAGGFFPPQLASKADNGWKISGKWKFASGCMGADWLGVGFIPDKQDPQNILWAIYPHNEVEIEESWHVVGMQGTGSHDLVLNDKFIDPEWTCTRSGDVEFDDPLYRYPALAYQAQIHAAVNIGLARAALDIAIEMADETKIIPGAARLSSRAYFKSTLAQSEVKWQSARMYFYDVSQRAWEYIVKGEEVPRDLHNMMYISASHAAHTSADIIQDIFRICGICVIHKGHRLQLIARDSMVVTQHAAVSLGNFEAGGAVLVNADPGFPYI
ncbi:acyl-CoA dehydrogenase [Marinomonas sp. CT5]|uniref:acyl-CoA dehydrogenase family protein n=1 Tax=Marinomonas sp. CT5 TaxID=2066133 RepID=UPI001BAFAE98|nr:acyl-CoA dehydrogenase family protein [Marinomonas sp. CT5]QUX97164.1 acyl-CoA dehydrogenase [Marinomonas sp. CT5]